MEAAEKKTQYLTIGLALAIFMSSLDTSVVNVVLPTLVKVFKASFAQVQWVVLSYLLVISSVIVGVGKIGDIFGKKRLCLIGVFIFTAASVLCGLSENILLLIGNRAIQGVGAAVIMALSFAIAQEAIPKDKIVRAMTILTAMISLGFAVGPTTGGFFIERFGWQSIFFFNLPIGIIAFLLIKEALPADQKQKNNGFDIKGMVSLAAALAAYIWAMTLSEVYGFLSIQVGLLLLAALFIGSYFIWVEKRGKAPLIPLYIFRDKILSASLIASVFVYSNMTCAQMLAAFFLAGVNGFSELQIGIALSVGPVITTVCGFIAGYLEKYFTERSIMVMGILIMVLGNLFMTTMQASNSYWDFCWRIAFMNGGLAFFQTPNNLLVMGNAAPEQRGIVSGLLALGRNLGLVTGAAVMSTIFALFIIRAAGAEATNAMADPKILVSAYHYTFFIMVAYMLLTAIVLVYGIKKKKTV